LASTAVQSDSELARIDAAHSPREPHFAPLDAAKREVWLDPQPASVEGFAALVVEPPRVKVGIGRAVPDRAWFRRSPDAPRDRPRELLVHTFHVIESDARRRVAVVTRLVALTLALTASLLASAAIADGDGRPNVVLVVVDDAGYTDFGAYGSEIATPTIDALAAGGARFSNFHASPMCAPSRAMLLTGLDSHTAGVANLPETVPPEHVGRPGYLGHLAENVVTVATILRSAGYHTYMAGKWHLGHTPGALPNGQGFERSFALDATGGDNWEQRPYLPIYENADWFEDGQAVRLPEKFYSSEFLVDRIIDYVDSQHGDGQPFFAYLPFMAIHIPIQAPREFVERYAGVYDDGWKAQRERRYRGAIASGLIASDTPLGPPPAGLRDWSALSSDEKRFQAKSMAVNAGMLEAMDHHLGRLIAHLREIGAYENTLFIVVSDNGAESGDPASSAAFKRWLSSVGYSRDVEHLGEKGTFTAIGPETANANVAPGALFKFYAAEGGVRVPLVMSGPGIAPAQTERAFAYITDITPTILDFATVAAPSGPAPITGRSLRPVLDESAVRIHADDEPVGMEAAGSAALWKGSHKLVKDLPPYGDAQWHLYDIDTDPGETRDLSKSDETRYDELLADYRAFAARVGVLEVPAGYTTFGQLSANMGSILVRRYAVYIGAVGVVLLVSIAWIGRALWRRFT